MDEYFNLKTIALLQPDLSKIPVYYADKFMILRKKLLFSHHINNISPKELKLLCITPNQEHKVLLSVMQGDHCRSFTVYSDDR
jgi:hypothetical protein